MAKPRITQEELKQLIHYDPETGIFTWIKSVAQGIHPGDIAGSWRGGYRRIRIDKVFVTASKVAWCYMTGDWPPEGMEIDHFDRDQSNDAFSNLRIVTHAENMQNKNIYRSSTTGFTGVTGGRKGGKWRARISLHGARIHLGDFRSREEANAAYLEAKQKLHPGAYINSRNSRNES